jgi:hypothetical protein
VQAAILVTLLAVINWNSDLDVLQHELPKLHPNAFHAISREQFDRSIATLRVAAPTLPPHVVVAEIARIVASIGDGHTRLTPPVDPNADFFLGHTSTKLPDDPALRFHHLPARFYLYADGLFITQAENGALIGKRVLRIGDKTADEAIAALAPFAAADNESGRRLAIGELLAMPEMLHAAGITARAERVPLQVDGASVTLDPVPFGAPVPWLQKRETRKFFFTYDETSRAVIAVINEIGNEEKETLAAFIGRVMKFMEARGADALVLDLRGNPGGNGYFNKFLIHALIRNPKFERPGHLFVLMGRRTFSAATFLLLDLEHHTTALFAGETSGGSPNGWGDSRKITLPSSGLTVRASTLYWQKSDPRDTRDAVAPDIIAPPTSTHPDAAREAVLAAIRASHRTGTVAGEWHGSVVADWQRLAVSIKDGRIEAPDLKLKSDPIPSGRRVRVIAPSAEGKITFDLEVGDGVIFGSLTGPEGFSYPLVLQR